MLLVDCNNLLSLDPVIRQIIHVRTLKGGGGGRMGGGSGQRGNMAGYITALASEYGWCDRASV